MPETVKFSLFGERRLEFDELAVTWRAKERYPVPLPGHLLTATIRSETRIPYQRIVHVGTIRRRQGGMLAVALIGALLGAVWFPQYWGQWAAFAGCAFFVALIGVWPLYLFIVGRRYLLIASPEDAIVIPADRKKKQLGRALELLAERGVLERKDA